MPATIPPDFEPEDTKDGEQGPRPRVVLVAIDFSAVSRRALAWALDFAGHTPCHLHTVHVVDKRWRLGDLRADLDSLRAELVDVHDAAVAELGPLVDDDTRSGLSSFHEHVAIGHPADEIVALAEEIHADLIIVGSHGGDVVHRVLVGSVAQRVVRDAPCPVVVVKG